MEKLRNAYLGYSFQRLFTKEKHILKRTLSLIPLCLLCLELKIILNASKRCVYV